MPLNAIEELKKRGGVLELSCMHWPIKNENLQIIWSLKVENIYDHQNKYERNKWIQKYVTMALLTVVLYSIP